MRWLSLVLVLLCGCDAAFAVEFFRARGDHSINAVFGLPTPLSTAGFSVSGTYANMFAGGETEDELLLLDAERAELRFSLYRQFSACSGLGIELPIIAHAEGYFDRAIESWHDLFNLPNGNRDDSEPNQLSIAYTNTASERQTLSSTSSSVGDVHLQLISPAACHVFSGFLPRANYRVGLKLPTGDEQLLSGSGAVDAYIDITSMQKMLSRRTAVRGAAGLLLLGDSDLFSNEESLVFYGSALVGYQYSPRVELKVQLDWHSKMFDSELVELGDFAAQAAFGASWQLQRGWIDFAFQEDIIPDTAPDITLYIAWHRQFY